MQHPIVLTQTVSEFGDTAPVDTSHRWSVWRMPAPGLKALAVTRMSRAGFKVWWISLGQRTLRWRRNFCVQAVSSLALESFRNQTRLYCTARALLIAHRQG